jgi:uracil-DNA glycosylase family 4
MPHEEQLKAYLEFFEDLGMDWFILPSKALEEPIMKTTRKTAPSPAAVDAGQKPKLAVVKELFIPVASQDPDLPSIRADIGDCRRCKLHSTRQNIVFGSGDPQAKVMFIGEAPGADEDEQGLPFVGRAGQLLTKIIEAISFTRDQVYIANIIKCRPPGNRNPEGDEIAACQGFLYRQIAVIKPAIICALGTYAVQTLLQNKIPIGQLRGRLFDFQGTKLIATYHPAYLLRNPNEKRKTWEDVKMLRAYYDAHCV